MARRSLKPQLNQIRTWVRQGRTDAWVAHQLEVSVRDIREFKREHGLEPGEAPESSSDVLAPAAVEEQPDLRAEDDALIAAELDAEPVEVSPETAEEEPGDAEEGGTRRRRRGRRGGRGRRRSGRSGVLEATFDHGAEGYGLWLDPAVQDNPVYAEHWAGHRPVTVTVEPERIVIERAGEGRAPGVDAGEGEDASGGDSVAEGSGAAEDAVAGDSPAEDASGGDSPAEDAGAGETAESVTSGGNGSPSEP